MEISKRIGYIDALRGFAIFMIVFMHIEHFSLGITYDKSIWGSIIITFFLPIFFFISGFFTKNTYVWNYHLFKIIKEKAIYLIIPALFFYFFYYCIYRGESITFLLSKGPRCYWFTFALFYVFLIYYVIQFFCQKLHNRFKEIVLLSISILALLAFIGGTKFYDLDFFPLLCLSNVCRYFWYFVLGYICHNHYDRFQRLISDEKIKTITFSLFTLAFIVTWNKNLIQYSLIHVWLLEYALWDLGTLLIIIIFYNYRKYLEADCKTPHFLRYIGKRTLDIYLVHWFFIPDLNQWYQIAIKQFAPENSIFELIFVILISFIVLFLCLITSIVIRSSTILGHYLLGAKLPEK